MCTGKTSSAFGRWTSKKVADIADSGDRACNEIKNRDRDSKLNALNQQSMYSQWTDTWHSARGIKLLQCSSLKALIWCSLIFDVFIAIIHLIHQDKYNRLFLFFNSFLQFPTFHPFSSNSFEIYSFTGGKSPKHLNLWLKYLFILTIFPITIF